MNRDSIEFRMVAEALPHMVWLARPDGSTQYQNRLLQEFFGVDAGSLQGWNWQDNVHPDDRQRAVEAWQDAVAKGVSYQLEYRLRRQDGVYLWHEMRAVPLRDEAGAVINWLGTETNIDERKRIEVMLGESERKFRMLHESMRDAFVCVSMDGQIHEFNDAYLDLLGYSPEELRTKTYVDLTPEKWHAYEARIVAEQILPRSYSDVYEKEYRRKDGTLVPVELRTVLLRATDGTPELMWAVIRDISARKRLEMQLLASEERFRGLMDLSPDIISIVREDGTLAYNSPAALAVHGYSQEEMIGRNTFDLIHPDDQPLCTAYVDSLLKDVSVPRSVQYRYRNKDGSYVWMEATAANQMGNPLIGGLIVISRDISARKSTELELAESRRALERERDVLRALMDGAKMSHLVYLDRDFNFLHVNETYAQTCGYRPEEMIGKNHFALYPNVENEAIFTQVRDTGEPFTVRDKPFEFPDDPGRGVTYWDWTLTAAKDVNGLIIGLVFSLFETTDRKRMEQRLRLSEETFSKAFHNGLLLMTISEFETGRYIDVNEVFCEVSGFSKEEAVGQSSIALGWVQAEDRQAIFEELKIHRRVAGRDIKLTSKRGETVWCRYFGELITSGGVQMVLSIAQDITESKAVAAALERAKVAAEAANRAKSEFLANMSHEIRTPITAIMGMSELLDDTELSASQRGYLKTILASTEDLLALIDEILDLSKVEANRLELGHEVFSLRGLLREVVAAQLPIAKAKGVALNSNIPVGVPDQLSGDPLRLKQILSNLVGNAVKFTGRGEVALTVVVEGLRGDGVCLDFAVADTGIGIRPELQEAIFSPFQQADSSISRNYGGTGLGLAICTRLVKLLGGTLRVESREGVGSTFHVRVTFALAESGAVGNGESNGRCLPLSTKRPLSLLLAEDNDTSRMFFVEVLQKYDYRVETALNGKEALEKWLQGGYDMVLMDIQMPIMDGLTAIDRIREVEKERGGHVPVIAITAHAMEMDRETIISRGFDGYLAKPTRIRELLDEIERCRPPCSSGPAGSARS